MFDIVMLCVRFSHPRLTTRKLDHCYFDLLVLKLPFQRLSIRLTEEDAQIPKTQPDDNTATEHDKNDFYQSA